jgi:hypothetical protein
LVAPVTASAALVLMLSPKRHGDVTLFANAARWLPAHFGVGVFGDSPLATLGPLIVVLVAVVLWRLVARSETVSSSERMLVAGAVVMVLAVFPLVVVGFPTATSGLFDRGNLYVDLGTAMVFGAIACIAIDHLWRVAAGAAIVAISVVMVAVGVTSVRDYTSAAAEGRVLASRLDRDLATVDQPLVVGPPLRARDGVATLLASWDTSAFMQLARGDGAVKARMACTIQDFADAPEPLRYDWLTRSLHRESGTAFGSSLCRSLGL